MAMTLEQIAERRAQVKQLCDQLAELVSNAPTHSTALEALAAMYQTVAEVHPCCTEQASQTALLVHLRLKQVVLERPAGAAVH